jgi:hypothetical protein
MIKMGKPNLLSNKLNKRNWSHRKFLYALGEIFVGFNIDPDTNIFLNIGPIAVVFDTCLFIGDGNSSHIFSESSKVIHLIILT